MRNWDEDSPFESYTSSKSREESEQSSSTKIKMEANSAKKTPNGLDLTKATTYRESAELTGSIVAASPVQARFDTAARKKLLRKLDRHLIPFLALIYL
jgi:septal ring-binding cell division protein DamX